MSGRKRGMESTTATSHWTMAAKPPGAVLWRWAQSGGDSPFLVETGLYRSKTSLLWLLQLKKQTGDLGALKKK